jgi:carbonic anhydrase/acetyltransferase-like protein (isoleucine patch superfamily)
MFPVNHTQRIAYYLSQVPNTNKALFVANNATCVGAVHLGMRSSVFYQAVLRGDIQEIIVGEETNIQDSVVIHVADDYPCVVGDRVTVGHRAILHACTIGNECLVGMGATVLDGSVIGDNCIIGANSLVTQGFQAPAGSLIFGAPARIVRELTQQEIQAVRNLAKKYLLVAEAHQQMKSL